MSEIDTVTVQAEITWLEARMAFENFLGDDELPRSLGERELHDLHILIVDAQKRLQEKEHGS